jgi:hypothetical protein
VNADKFAHATSGRGARIGSSFYCGNVATDDSRNESGTDLFVSDKLNVSGLYHRVGRLDHRNKTLGLDHS